MYHLKHKRSWALPWSQRIVMKTVGTTCSDHVVHNHATFECTTSTSDLAIQLFYTWFVESQQALCFLCKEKPLPCILKRHNCREGQCSRRVATKMEIACIMISSLSQLIIACTNKSLLTFLMKTESLHVRRCYEASGIKIPLNYRYIPPLYFCF